MIFFFLLNDITIVPKRNLVHNSNSLLQILTSKIVSLQDFLFFHSPRALNCLDREQDENFPISVERFVTDDQLRCEAGHGLYEIEAVVSFSIENMQGRAYFHT